MSRRRSLASFSLIRLPLSTSPLLELCLGHNFSFLWDPLLGFFTMNKKLHYCPMPLAFGESGIGKTTALESANKRDIYEAECARANHLGLKKDYK